MLLQQRQHWSQIAFSGHLKAAGFRYRGKKGVLTEDLLKEFASQIEAHGIKPGAMFIESSAAERDIFDELLLE